MENSERIEQLVGGHQSSVVAVVANHCPHCKAVAPHLTALANDYEPEVQYLSVVADQDPAMAEALRVRGTPTVLAFARTTELARHVGGGSLSDIDRIFASARDGESTGRQPVNSTDRRIRAFVAAALIGAALFTMTWWLAVLGLAFAVGGFYDMLLPGRKAKGRDGGTRNKKLLAFGPQSASEMIERNEVVVIDIRTSREVASGMIEGAVHFDMTSGRFTNDVAELDGTKDYLLYCRSGKRSAQALRVFHAGGHTSASHLAGGVDAWVAAGLPIEPID